MCHGSSPRKGKKTKNKKQKTKNIFSRASEVPVQTVHGVTILLTNSSDDLKTGRLSMWTQYNHKGHYKWKRGGRKSGRGRQRSQAQKKRCDSRSRVGVMQFEDSTHHHWLCRWRKRIVNRGMPSASRSWKRWGSWLSFSTSKREPRAAKTLIWAQEFLVGPLTYRFVLLKPPNLW